MIQSPQKGCSYLINSLNTHLGNMRERVASMTDEQFSTVVNAVMTDVSAKNKNMDEENGSWWSELISHDYDFDRQTKKIETLKLITKPEFQSYFAAFFGQDS